MCAEATAGRPVASLFLSFLSGPTLELKPGDTLSLTLVNELGAESGAMAHNLMHFPNTTNLHTHGLHVDPLVDTVFISVAPGQSRTYVYKVPADHAPGLHWYHAHAHGSSTYVVMGGQQGVITVLPASSAVNVPARYTTMTKHVLMLSHIQFAQILNNNEISQGCANDAGCTPWQGCAIGKTMSPFSPFRSYSYLEMQPEIGDEMPAQVTYGSGGVTAVNQVRASRAQTNKQTDRQPDCQIGR